MQVPASERKPGEGFNMVGLRVSVIAAVRGHDFPVALHFQNFRE